MLKDMTTGTPWRLIVLFGLPLLAGNIFQQAYNLADTIIIGHYLGPNALAGVGVAFTAKNSLKPGFQAKACRSVRAFSRIPFSS